MTVDDRLISIIIVNWNGKHFLRDCLSALGSQSFSPLEIILVDNGSTDGSVDYVKRHYPRTIVVQLPENRGFAGGNQKGLEVARGQYIALLNNDTWVEKNWAEKLFQPMLQDSSIGICASQLLINNSEAIDSAGDGLTTWGVGFKRGFEENQKFFQNQEEVFGACAAACLYRRKMLDEIGFLDTDFFFNDEDTDLNFRAQLAGWKCLYVPQARVHHRVNASIGRLSDLHVYYHARNLEFLWIKNMPWGLMLRYLHHKMIQEVGSFCYLCLRHGKWGPFFKAKLDVLEMLPKMWKKRKKIQERKTVTNRHLQSILTSGFSQKLIGQKIRQFIRG